MSAMVMQAATVEGDTPAHVNRLRSAVLSALVMLDAALGLDLDQWRRTPEPAEPPAPAPTRARSGAGVRATTLAA